MIKNLLICIFILFQVFFIFFKTNLTLDIDISPNTRPSPKISGKRKIGQTFVAQRNGLSRIDVMFGTFGRENSKNVFFRLWELSNPRKLKAEVKFNSSEVSNSLYFPIKFKPIEDSKEKTYQFIFSSPRSNLDNSICVWINEDNIYREGNFWDSQGLSQGDMVFRAYSQRAIFPEIKRITRNYSGIFANKIFLIAAAVLFELAQIYIIFLFLGLIFRERQREDRSGE